MKLSDISEDIAEQFSGPARVPEPPKAKPAKPKRNEWQPNVGPVGTDILLDKTSKYILAHGERASGKTAICLHKVILEVQDQWNGLGMMVSITRSSATEGGSWEKLNENTLPEWAEGVGLEATEPKMDDQKNRHVFISNKYGDWGRIVLRSMPYGANIQQRIKGMEPSIFFFDELTEAETPDYFTKPIQQLGRRPKIGYQPYIAACNPPEDGPEHWVYKRFFPNTEKGETLESKRKRGFGVYHCPIGTENVWWSPEQKAEYQQTLMEEAIHDPSAEDRLIRGLWVARPTGAGLFSEHYIPALHLKPLLMPINGFPIILGYDLGQVFSSVTLMQLIPTRDGRLIWLIFDEVDRLGMKILYKKLAVDVMDRIAYWSAKMQYDFQAIHITDDSAINQWRPGQGGSYDAWEFEQEYNRQIKPGGRNVKMEGCPKGDGSVAARIRMLQSTLYQEEIFISAKCENTAAMLRSLDSDKDNPDKPRRTKWLHKFDSVTYPMLKMGLGGTRKYLRLQRKTPSLTACGV